MKLDDIYNEFDKKVNALDSIVIPNNEAWMNEDGTDHARIDGKSVQLDVEDEAIRKKVFTRSILRAIRKRNWHTDIIKTIDDVDTCSDNQKLAVFHDGNSYMFPNYRIYLAEDGKKRNEYAEDAQNVLRTLWKTDHEFFMDVVKENVERVLDNGEYSGYFIKYFNENNYGITIEDIRKYPEVVKMVKDMIFENLTDVNKQFDDDDD